MILADVLQPGEWISLDDAIDLAWMAVATGKAVHPKRWITALIEQNREASMNAFAPG